MKSAFPKINGRVTFNEPLAGHTTFRIGGPCSAWIEPHSERDLKKILRFAKLRKVFIIGAGSNVLAGDGKLNRIVIHLDATHFGKVRFAGSKIIAGAGVMLSTLIGLACKRGLKGVEGLAGIPGTLGGAIATNAGSRGGSISDCLESVRVMDKDGRGVRVIEKKNLKFSYRHSSLKRHIILEAVLGFKKCDKKSLARNKRKLLNMKKRTQPLGNFSAGCVFKNPAGKISAAQYIDRLCLKGKTAGGAKVSEKHANFILNSGNAKARDVIKLINLLKKCVKEKFSIDLKTEIQII